MVATAAAQIGSAIATGFGILKTAAPVVSTIAGIKESEAATKATEEQAKLLKEEQEAQAAEIKKQKGIALEKRKTLLRQKRRQLVGAGDAVASLTATSEVGVLPSADTAGGATLTGGVLG